MFTTAFHAVRLYPVARSTGFIRLFMAHSYICTVGIYKRLFDRFTRLRWACLLSGSPSGLRLPFIGS